MVAKPTSYRAYCDAGNLMRQYLSVPYLTVAVPCFRNAYPLLRLNKPLETMAFPKSTILAVIAASACLMSADAFAPVAPSVSVASGARSVSASVPQQLMSTLEDVDEEVED